MDIFDLGILRNIFSLSQFRNNFSLHACILVKLFTKSKPKNRCQTNRYRWGWHVGAATARRTTGEGNQRLGAALETRPSTSLRAAWTSGWSAPSTQACIPFWLSFALHPSPVQTQQLLGTYFADLRSTTASQTCTSEACTTGNRHTANLPSHTSPSTMMWHWRSWRGCSVRKPAQKLSSTGWLTIGPLQSKHACRVGLQHVLLIEINREEKGITDFRMVLRLYHHERWWYIICP